MGTYISVFEDDGNVSISEEVGVGVVSEGDAENEGRVRVDRGFRFAREWEMGWELIVVIDGGTER